MQQEVKAILTAEDRGFTSTIQKAQDATESFGSKIKSGIGFGVLMRAGQKAFDAIGNAISSNLAGATKRFDTLQNFPKVMQSLGYGADEAKASMDTLANSIDHLPTTLDAVASQVQSVVAVTGDLGKATDLTLALNNAMAAGGAPAEAQASAINQWVQAMAKGKPDMQDWRALVQTAPAQMDQLAKSLLGASANQNILYEALKNGEVTMDEVNSAMIDLAQNGGEGFASWAEQAKNAGAGINMALVNVKAAVQRNLANVMTALDERLAGLGGISGVIQSVVAPINAVGEAIGNVISGKLSFTEALTGLLDSISAKVPLFVNKGLELVLNLAIGIAKGLPQLLVNGLNAITNFINGLGQGNGKLASKAIELVTTLAYGLVKNAPQILAAGLNLMVALLRGVVNGFAAIPRKVLSMAKGIPNAVKSGAGNLGSIGRNLIDGLWGGIKAKFDSVIDRVKALAAKLPAAVKKVLGIGSPSRVMNRQVGRWIPAGLAQGIRQNTGLVTSAMANLVSIPSQTMGRANYAMAADYEYGVSARYEVTVPVMLNGREIARATVGDMQTALDQRQTRANRKVGIR